MNLRDYVETRVFSNGENLLTSYDFKNESTNMVGGGILILGQDQVHLLMTYSPHDILFFNLKDTYDGGFEMQETFSGLMSRFNIWSQAIDLSYLNDIATCKSKIACKTY